jgi:2,5-dioxopentanoate dehydrogenase
MTVSQRNIIGFEFSTKSNEFFRTYFPEKDEYSNYHFAETTDEEIEAAFQKASNSFLRFRNSLGTERAELLLLIAKKIDENREDLVSIYQLESALPKDRANIELNRTIFQLKEFANLISTPNWNFCSEEEADNNRKPTPKPSLQKKLIPIGPIVVFGASNFPFAYSTIGGDTASALAAACPVIVKSHPYHAGTGDLIAQLVMNAIKELNFPDGIFSNLNSKGFELGQKLISNPFCKGVAFTGSQKGGLAIQKTINCRKDIIPFFAEMGSVNPIFIFESSLEDSSIVQKISSSISLNAGQFCTNPGLIFIVKSEKSELFKEELIAKLENVEPQIMLHPTIKTNFENGVLNLVRKNKTKVLLNNNSRNEKEVFPVIQEIQLADFVQDTDFQEEVFGMHTIIVECNDNSDFLEISQVLKGQLTISLFLNENDCFANKKLIDELQQKAGRIIFNGVPTGVEVSTSMQHGGPFPATTDARFTAVGSDAIYRFLRPITYQNLFERF